MYVGFFKPPLISIVNLIEIPFIYVLYFSLIKYCRLQRSMATKSWEEFLQFLNMQFLLNCNDTSANATSSLKRFLKEAMSYSSPTTMRIYNSRLQMIVPKVLFKRTIQDIIKWFENLIMWLYMFDLYNQSSSWIDRSYSWLWLFSGFNNAIEIAPPTSYSAVGFTYQSLVASLCFKLPITGKPVKYPNYFKTVTKAPITQHQQK